MEAVKRYSSLKEFEKTHGEAFVHLLKLLDSKVKKKGVVDEGFD